MPVYRLKAGDKAVIRRRVAALHVTATARDVVGLFTRDVRRAFRSDRPCPAYELWRKRGTRRAVYREALRQHARNRDLFRKVATGRF